MIHNSDQFIGGKHRGRLIGWHTDNDDIDTRCLSSVTCGAGYWHNAKIKSQYKEADGFARLVDHVGIDNYGDFTLFESWWPEHKDEIAGGYRVLVGVFGKNTLTFAEYVCIRFCEYMEPEGGDRFLQGSQPEALDGFALGIDRSCKFQIYNYGGDGLSPLPGKVIYLGGNYPVSSPVLCWLNLNQEVDRYVSRT